MVNEIINPEGNPVTQGAEKIRATVKNLVQENLEGIFPKNWQWRVGDYNLIFAIAEGFGNRHGGFYSSAQMVVLTTEGDFKSGRVSQRVADEYSAWEFNSAKLNSASDLEVVRFGPQLVNNLFGQLESELYEEEASEKIAKGINFLYQNSEFYSQALAVSRHALVEMGEVDPTLVHRDTGQPSIKDLDAIIKALEEQTPYKVVRGQTTEITLEQKKVAIDLFMNKDTAKTEMAETASSMRTQLVKDRFSQIIKEMVEKEIFPAGKIDEEGVSWVGTDDFGSGIHSEGRHRNLFWQISSDGQILERGLLASEGELSFCAEHLLTQAPQILGRLIDKSAKRIFPKLKVQ